MSRPESMVFLIPGFPADEADTSCLPAVQNYVAAYAAAHPEQAVHVVAFQYPFTRSSYRWKGATVHALGGRNRRGLARLRTWQAAAGRLLGLARHTRIRVLHSFWLGECALVGQWMNRLLRVRHVASIGGQDAQSGNRYLKHLAFRRMMVTAGSAFAAETFCRSTSRRVEAIVPLGLDADALRQLGTPAAERTIDVLGVGSLTPVKDYGTFLDVIERLIPRFPTLRAVLIGDGPQRDALARRIRENALTPHVRLAGPLPREAVYRHMLRSRVLLHPSRYESQGYVFLEALLAGMYVVCRDVGYTGASDAAFACASAADMAERLALLLNSAPPLPCNIAPVADTVAAFEALYA